MRRSATIIVAGLVAGLAAFGGALLAPAPDTEPPPIEPSVVPAGLGAGPAPADPATLVASLEARVATVPGDHIAWATLALAHVELARIDGDLDRYAAADRAANRSLVVEPDGNALALTARAAIAAARHDFPTARDDAEAALSVNPYHAATWGILSDARVQLGDLVGGAEASQRMVDLQPGTASLARVSYVRQLEGDLDEAERLMRRALDEAANDSDRAFAHVQLGELALAADDPAGGLDHHLAALALQPGNVGALAGKAHALRLLGQVETAALVYAELVERAPLPDFLAESAAHLATLGRHADADALVEQARRGIEDQLANGFVPDAGIVVFEATYGDPEAALALAEELLARGPSADVVAAHELAVAAAAATAETSG